MEKSLSPPEAGRAQQTQSRLEVRRAAGAGNKAAIQTKFYSPRVKYLGEIEAVHEGTLSLALHAFDVLYFWVCWGTIPPAATPGTHTAGSLYLVHTDELHSQLESGLLHQLSCLAAATDPQACLLQRTGIYRPPHQ